MLFHLGDVADDFAFAILLEEGQALGRCGRAGAPPWEQRFPFVRHMGAWLPVQHPGQRPCAAAAGSHPEENASIGHVELIERS